MIHKLFFEEIFSHPSFMNASEVHPKVEKVL